MSYYTVYKTTNLINNMIYIGVHKTDNPNDLYLGSGKYLKQSIKFYGRDNFKKEILKIFDSMEEAYSYEKLIVNLRFVESKNTYNLTCGGVPTIEWCESRIDYYRQFSGEKSNRFKVPHSEETKQRIKSSMLKKWADPIFRDKCIQACKTKMTEEFRLKISNANKGKKLSDTDKLKKSISAKNRIKVVCPHCGKTGDNGNMMRWHFDKCKLLIL